MYKLLAKIIFKRISADMGNWFDEIQGREEDVFNEIEGTLQHGTIKEKIKLIKYAFSE